jgi:hypothetical protein
MAHKIGRTHGWHAGSAGSTWRLPWRAVSAAEAHPDRGPAGVPQMRVLDGVPVLQARPGIKRKGGDSTHWGGEVRWSPSTVGTDTME